MIKYHEREHERMRRLRDDQQFIVNMAEATAKAQGQSPDAWWPELQAERDRLSFLERLNQQYLQHVAGEEPEDFEDEDLEAEDDDIEEDDLADEVFNEEPRANLYD